MSDEKSQQQTSTESTVAGAAKTGKAISNIAKGAAAGGAHGAAIEAGKSSAKWLIPLIAAVLLPLILVLGRLCSSTQYETNCSAMPRSGLPDFYGRLRRRYQYGRKETKQLRIGLCSGTG